MLHVVNNTQLMAHHRDDLPAATTNSTHCHNFCEFLNANVTVNQMQCDRREFTRSVRQRHGW